MEKDAFSYTKAGCDKGVKEVLAKKGRRWRLKGILMSACLIQTGREPLQAVTQESEQSASLEA